MTNDEKATMIAQQCLPCSSDFYKGIYQGVKIGLDTKDEIKLRVVFRSECGAPYDTVMTFDEYNRDINNRHIISVAPIIE